MNFPLDALSAVSAANPWSYLVFAGVGFAFGFTLEMAGFGDSRKLAGQFYFQELTVLKVMFTAIAVAMVLLFGAVGLGVIDFSHVWVNPTYLGSGIVGGLVMGVGFIVGGFCPTTSLASASTGRIDGMLFMAGGFVGAFLFGETEGLFDRWYNNAGYYGRLTLDDVFGVSAPAVVLVVAVAAVLMFVGAEQLERIFAGRQLDREPRMRKVGAGALVAAALAVVVIGTPSIEERYAQLSFKRTEVVERVGARPVTLNHVYNADEMLVHRLVFASPAEAYKLRYQQAIQPIYLDVRGESDFNLYHLADSLHVPLERIGGMVPELLAQPPSNTVYVLIGNDEAAAVQAWKRLVASRVQNVYVLEGGINHWIATFGANDPALKPLAAAAPDQLRYAFDAALGDRYESCAPSPLAHEKLAFKPRIVVQQRRDKSGGGCG